MNYIQYKQWADHCESLQHQAIDSSLEDDGEFAAIFLVVTICLFSFIIAMIISA